MTMLLRIAERVINRPLLVHPDKVPLILGVLEGRIPIDGTDEWRRAAEMRIAELPADARAVMHGPLPNVSRFVGDDMDEDPATGERRLLPYRRTAEGVAIIPAIGVLVNRGAWLGASPSWGEVSYEGLKYQVQQAIADPRAKSIVLDIETPGGEAIGAFEMAETVRDAARSKPVVAVVNGMAASAGYALASGASRIVTTPTGVSGSIGVVLLHADFSRAYDKKGITPTLIFAGAHKVDGNPFEPLPDGVRDDLQREVNQYYGLFVDTVAAGRRQMSPAAIRATEGRIFIGAEAVDVGLADEVGSFEDVLAELSRGSSGRSTSSQPRGMIMDNPKGAPAAETAGISKADHDTAVAKEREEGRAEGLAQGKAEGEKTARTAGAAEERKRILGIQKAAFPGQDELVVKLIDEGTSIGDAAVALNEAEKAKGPARLAAMRSAEEGLAGKVPATPHAGQEQVQRPTDTAGKTDDQLKADWHASDALRAEFVTAEDYVGLVQAERAGKVRILRGKDERAA